MSFSMFERWFQKDGDEKKAYCSKCGRETTWVYKWHSHPFGGHGEWMCLGCGTKRS